MRVVVVPGTLALLPEYASAEDPVPDLRRAVRDAVAWLLEDGPASLDAGADGAVRVGTHLLDGGGRAASAGGRPAGSSPGLLVVANGSAKRTEKAPGHFDDRAAAFDATIGKALADGDPGGLANLELALADELWAMPDAGVLRDLGRRDLRVTRSQVDYDDAPYGVQYWVVRWQCT